MKQKRVHSYRFWSLLRFLPLFLFLWGQLFLSYLVISESSVVILKKSLSHSLSTFSYILEKHGVEKKADAAQELMDVMAALTLGYEGAVCLLYDYMIPTIQSPTELSPRAVDEIMSGLNRNISFLRISSLHRDYYVISRDLEDFSLSIAVLIPSFYVDDHLRGYIRSLWIITFLLTAIFLITLFLLSGSISKPFLNLTDLIGMIESGQFSREFVDRTTRESELVSHRINKMLAELKALHDDNYRKEIESNRARLRALHAQINPHFLFNTLNSIKSLAYSNRVKDISAVTTELARMLRYGIYDFSELVPLKEEIGHVEAYLKIEEYRNGDLFNFRIEDTTYNEDQMVPKLILQPLVENFIKHGLSHERLSEIRISARREGCLFLILIEDDGIGIEKESLSAIRESFKSSHPGDAQGGIGILNVHRRMSVMFGIQYGIKIDSLFGEGTRIELRLPHMAAGNGANV